MNTFNQAENALITHHSAQESSYDLAAYRRNLENKQNLILPLAVEMDLLDQLTEFEFGRFLLANRGIDGYWTAYMILHGPFKSNLPPLEDWILHSAPALKATQERFKIFQTILQKYLKNDVSMASIPCGLMDDLLGLDFAQANNAKLIGVDLDVLSLKRARENAKKYGRANATFYQQDAWHLDFAQTFDVIASNGLNFYQADDEQVILLYKEFYKALKPGGVLITSFLTPPPTIAKDSSWRNYNVEDLKKQIAIFIDILEAKCQIFRSESQTRAQLSAAGFQVQAVIYDAQGVFPTVVAQRPSHDGSAY